MPGFCSGCYNCIVSGEGDCCPHFQLLKPITDSINDADLLIFTTPVYCMGTSGDLPNVKLY